MDERAYPNFPIPGVTAVVFGSKGVLLLRRHKEPAKGLWTIPGGGIEIGEKQEDTAVREVFEETGVECKLIGFLSTYDVIIPDSKNEIKYHFVLNHYLATAQTEQIRPEFPGAEVAWFDLSDLPVDEMRPEIVQLIHNARKTLEETATQEI